MIIYRPSICRQTSDLHTHYNIVLSKVPLINDQDIDLIRKMAAKVGGRTAGQVVELLIEKRGLGFNLSLYGIEFIDKETVPLYQVCYKNGVESPSIDWDTMLFTPVVETPNVAPTSGPKVGRIRHTRD